MKMSRLNMSMSKLKLTAVAALALLSLLAASCGGDGDGDSSAPVAPQGDFKLGYILPLSGDLSFLSDPMIRGVEMAIAEVGAAGFQTIEAFPGDSGTDPAIATNTADDLVAKGVHGIVGAAASSISLAIIDKVIGAQIPMISPSNTAPTFTGYDDDGYYFRTSVTDALQGQVLGDLVTDNGGIDVAILFRADDWGRGLSAAAKAQLEANGATVVEFISLDPTGTTFLAEVQEVSVSGVDSIILMTFEEGAKAIAQMSEAGIGPQDIQLYVPDGLAAEELGQIVDPDDPSSVHGITAIRPAPSAGAEATFPDRFAAFAPGVDSLFAPHSYDAVVVMLLAALVAGSNDPADYVGEINGVTRGGVKCARYAECAQLVLDGEDIDYDGASGPLDFIDAGEPSTGTYDINEYDAQGVLNKIDSVTLSFE